MVCKGGVLVMIVSENVVGHVGVCNSKMAGLRM
jgi:hypothetical protein